jgi:hypothetical protein
VSSVLSIADQVFRGLTDQQARPSKGLNSLVWLLWHMARVEDFGVNVIVTAGQQVLDEGWFSRLGVLRTDVGNGMTEDELTRFATSADIAAIRAYRDAVGRRTRDVVETLGPASWAELVSPADAARVPDWFKVFVEQPRAFELGTAAITHNAIHLGEAVTIRHLLGTDGG